MGLSRCKTVMGRAHTPAFGNPLGSRPHRIEDGMLLSKHELISIITLGGTVTIFFFCPLE